MCGIAGCLWPGANADELAHAVGAMAPTLAHRGPDAAGEWTDPEHGVGLGFRRLAVVDLTPTGMQPMHTPSGRYTVVFNGEIYNHTELRAELYRNVWRGTSDTEVMLAAVERWGVAEALPRLRGMFAIALWDHATRSLTLARDRLGEKPLYYGLHGGALLFGSELKALRAHPAFVSRIDPDALANFLYASFVPSPRSIWQSTSKLPPGHQVTMRADDVAAGRIPDPKPYWKLGHYVHRAANGSVADAQTVDRLDSLLRSAVRGQMVADVPLGAFLSGGIDSSTVVALMQAESSRPITTFTVGIPDDSGLDESAFAARVASHLGTDHHTLQVTPAQARAVIPTLGTMYDEPFADSSQIPTHLVAALARSHVTVSLSGDGGDEMFGGYRRYTMAPKLAARTSWLPRPVRRGLAAPLARLPERVLDRGRPGLGRKAHQLAALLPAQGIDETYFRVFGAPLAAGLVEGHPVTPASLFGAVPAGPTDPVQSLMYHDALTYLPDDICTKVDRAAMAVSLETRMPFLDHRVVEFAWGLPADQIIRGSTSKWVLRQVLARYVPPELTERPKAGFGIPLGQWLRGPLRDWADDLLAPSELRGDALFDLAEVNRLWGQHRTRRADHTNLLWNVLMFQSWRQAN